MAEQYSIKIPSHHNIYTGTSNRELRIDFSTPQNGVNAKTGLVVFVPGFGGHIDSKVYKKMRDVMADKYNLVTIQCEYFGSKYMQFADSFTVQNTQMIESLLTDNELRMIKEKNSNLLDILSSKDIELHVLANINENLEEFNDMSYMQAIDIITAIESVKIILIDNELKFNENRVIGYGHSQGAYLLHLCNILNPYLFSLIIDNSAWVEPVYLSKNRLLFQKINKLILAVEFDYIAKKILKDKRRLNLKSLYKNCNNKSQILVFQGDNDNLVSYLEKKNIVESINNSQFILVKKEDVDNLKYKSNTHGLNADFLELFSFALTLENPLYNIPKKKSKYEVDLGELHIEVNNTLGLPVFNFKNV